MKLKLPLLVLLLSLVVAPLWAEPERDEAVAGRGVRHERHARGEMHADRPELTSSARVVAPGRVQLEAELVVEQEKGSDEAALVLPALVRVGVADNLEFRVESDLFRLEGEHAGLADLNLGVKWNFLQGDPALGLLVDVTFPAGNPRFTVDDPEPRLLLLADIPLSESWELRINAGAISPVDDGERVLRGLFGVAVFTELTDTVEAHLEWGRLSPNRVDDAEPINLAVGRNHENGFTIAVYGEEKFLSPAVTTIEDRVAISSWGGSGNSFDSTFSDRRHVDRTTSVHLQDAVRGSKTQQIGNQSEAYDLLFLDAVAPFVSGGE